MKTTRLSFYLQPLRDLYALAPLPVTVTRQLRRSVFSLLAVLGMFMLIPVFVPAPVGMFAEPQPAHAASVTSPVPATTMVGSDATGDDTPPGYVAPYGTYANSYYRGNCTYYVASRRRVPAGWSNASHWLSAARRAGWATGSTPQVGAIAWTGAGWAGHVAIVDQVQGSRVLVSEMNYYGFGRIDQRWTSASSFQYIY